MTRRNSPVRIIHPDGRITVKPAYDGPSLRRIINNPKLTDAESAVLHCACPRCNARPGRACRADGKPIKPHRARLKALRDSRQ